MDDLEDEALATIDGIPFIAEEGFTGQYGNSFAISLEDNQFALTPK